MAVNPLGYQILSDGGIPQIITGLVSTDQATISGGNFVYAGSKTAPLSSGTSSFVTSDILFAAPASGVNYPVGVACENAVSGAYISVLQKGIIIARCDVAVNASDFITAKGGCNCVGKNGSDANPIVVMNQNVGRALTSAGSEEFVLARIDL